MSLNNKIIAAVERVRDEFIAAIAEQYNLDAAEVLKLWDPEATPKKRGPKKASSDATLTDPERELMRLSKSELVELCKSKGLRHSGTKKKLIGFLTGLEDGNKGAKKIKAPKKVPAANTAVVKALQSSLPKLAIRRNAFGNHEHAESGLVFNSKTKKVIGRQQDDGTVAPLTDADIDECHRFKFEYELPEDLDQNAGLDGEEIEELDSEDEAKQEEDDELLEEELLEEDDEGDFEEELLDEDGSDFEDEEG